MHWPVLVAAVALAISFMQLGAMSAWVSVLLLVLKVVLFLLVIATVAGILMILWRRYM